MKTKFRILIPVFLLFLCTCKKENKVPDAVADGSYAISDDTSWNTLTVQFLSPDRTVRHTAWKIKESDGGYASQILNRIELRDSTGNPVEMRIYTVDVPLRDSVYHTTDNKYNPYRDKVYIELFRPAPGAKEDLYVSVLPQQYSYFYYRDPGNADAEIRFRYLAKRSDPEAFAVISGRFRIRR